MQLKRWWLTVALFLIHLVGMFLCVEPITTGVAIAAGASALGCKNIF